MKNDVIFSGLSQVVSPEKIKVNEPLHKYTYTKTGGKCDVLVLPTSYSETQDIIKFAISENIPYTILGNGSNLIIKDGGIRGIVINLLEMNSVTLVENKVIAQSGASIIETSHFALDNHLTGLEFACGIPGSVGGALYMNAGAYGGEVSDVLESAILLTHDGDLVSLRNEDLGLEYRNSLIAKNGYIVLEATFSLEEGSYDEIKSKMDELTFLRESKQPLEYPSCGSVFKRPPGHFAGKLIQDSGLQGVQIGGAQVSKKHAGFMVNVNNATATDYLALIKLVQKTVQDKFDVNLETEVKIIGED